MATTRELVTFEYYLDGVLKRTEQKMRTVYWLKNGTAKIEVLGHRKKLEARRGKLICRSNSRTIPANTLGPLELLESRGLATRKTRPT